jgi:molybdopterin synthase catalytic subunit
VADDVVRLVGISPEPLDVQALYELVRTRSAGGVALFVGVVRDSDSGKSVSELSYSAHPSADGVLRDVVQEVVAGTAEPTDDRVEAVAAIHRVGDLAVGDAAVVVAVGCRHRGLAFAVCERLVDEIKHRIPIWKHQVFADGSDEWVGTPG